MRYYEIPPLDVAAPTTRHKTIYFDPSCSPKHAIYSFDFKKTGSAFL
jgi:hypothetical protein